MSLTPRPYSTGTRARKRRSCCARRADSSAVSGAAVKPLRPAEIRSRADANAARSPVVAARASRRNCCPSARRGRVAAVLGVARREDRPVRGGLGGRLREPRGQLALGGRVRVAEQVALTPLVGVEQVLRHGLSSRVGVGPAALEAAERERRVGAWPRQSRRGPELAQQQPRAGLGDVAGADRRERHGHRAAEHRALERPARGGEPSLVAGRDRAAGGPQRSAATPASAAGAAAEMRSRSSPL